LTRPQRVLPNALDAVSDAMEVLETGPGRVRPDRTKFAVIGHSAGGNLAAQMAAMADEAGLPRPRAVIALMPGEVIASPTPALADVPGETLLIVAAAENDVVVGDARAREIFNETTAIPLSRKRYLFYRSDIHGFPPLIAEHFMSTGFLDRFDTGEGLMPKLQKQRAEINAFDHAALWPMVDLTLKAAFTGESLDVLSEGGERFKRLGMWSDGRPVTPPIVTDDVSDLPRVFPSNGLKLIRHVVNPALDAKIKQVVSP
jgi:acetyl esterase/lipase